jgi:hypothetical protein
VPDEDVAVVVVVVVVVPAPAPVAPPVPVVVPQVFDVGTQSLWATPFAPWTAVQMVPEGQALAEQSGAQYWSLANCPQNDPLAQFESCRQLLQKPVDAPVPLLPEPVVAPAPTPVRSPPVVAHAAKAPTAVAKIKAMRF